MIFCVSQIFMKLQCQIRTLLILTNTGLYYYQKRHWLYTETPKCSLLNHGLKASEELFYFINIPLSYSFLAYVYVVLVLFCLLTQLSLFVCDVTVPKKSVWTASIGSCLVSLRQCCHLKCHVYDSYRFLRHLLRMSVNMNSINALITVPAKQ